MLKLGSIFQDRAILQRGKTIPVWGKSAADAKIKIELAGVTAYGRSNIDGTFKIRLHGLEAGGPYKLKVTDCGSGEVVELDDILVGDVWLASGQSNMAYLLNSASAAENCCNPKGLNVRQHKEFQDNISNPEKFRFITVAQNASALEEESFTGEWKYMTKENASVCSAVAAWFGKYIREAEDVPVGLIISSWGGTIAEAWTSRAGLLANPETAALVDETDALYSEEINWNKTAEEVKKNKVKPFNAENAVADSGNEGVKLGWAETDFDDSSWKKMYVPGSWVAQYISGNGACWVRREVTVPDEWLGKDLQLEFGGIDKLDITYFNGVEIGRTGKDLETTWFDKPRNYKIPAELVKKGRNVIAVRAYSFFFDGAFTGREECYNLVLSGTDNKINLAGEWAACPERDLGNLAGVVLNIGAGYANTPSILFNGMIKVLLPYAIKGVIWYQGESNAKSLEDAASYLKKLEIMIRDWYYHFEQGEFPFIQVQLADYHPNGEAQYNKNSAWAVLRDVQRRLCEKMDKVYMVTAVDIGDWNDIHPQDKKTVGFRLAQNALHNVYHHREVIPFGPLYKGYSVEGGRVRLFFDNADGMYIKDDLPQSFYIAGVDGKYHSAEKVVIDNDTVIVSASKVKFPRSVCYAWANAPASTLYNSADLPASPFTTEI